MSEFRRSRAVTQSVARCAVNGGRPLLRLNSRPGLTGPGLATLASSFRRRREVIKRGDLPRGIYGTISGNPDVTSPGAGH